MIREWCEGCIISRNHPGRASNSCRQYIDPLLIDIQFATAYSTIRLLPATHLVSSYQITVTCDYVSCTTTHLLVDIVVVGKTYLTVSRDFYCPHQYQFVRKYVRACEVCQRVKSSPSLEPRCSLCPSRPSAGNLSQWTLALDSPQTLTRIMVFLCSLTGSARWYIWLYPNQSTHRLVPMSLSTRPFAFMGCLVNSCPIGNRGSQLSSKVPCSKHSERA